MGLCIWKQAHQEYWNLACSCKQRVLCLGKTYMCFVSSWNLASSELNWYTALSNHFPLVLGWELQAKVPSFSKQEMEVFHKFTAVRLMCSDTEYLTPNWLCPRQVQFQGAMINCPEGSEKTPTKMPVILDALSSRFHFISVITGREHGSLVAQKKHQ